jgi:hypothetical protein
MYFSIKAKFGKMWVNVCCGAGPHFYLFRDTTAAGGIRAVSIFQRNDTGERDNKSKPDHEFCVLRVK